MACNFNLKHLSGTSTRWPVSQPDKLRYLDGTYTKTNVMNVMKCNEACATTCKEEWKADMKIIYSMIVWRK